MNPADWLQKKAKAAQLHAASAWTETRRARARRIHAEEIKRFSRVLPVQLNASVGLFAHLSWCLRITSFAEAHGLLPVLSCVSPQYGENDQDWFSQLFDQPHLKALREEPLPSPLIVHEFEELPFYAAPEYVLSLPRATQLQRRYFPVREEIRAQVDEFAQKHLHGHAVVACHFRGTDKCIEADRVSAEAIGNAVEEEVSALGTNAAVFVATDERAFVEYLTLRIAPIPVFSAPHQRSADSRAVHFSSEFRGLRAGREALIDSLLLAKGDILVKTPSLLSAWSRVFNPALRVRLIGRPMAHVLFFPENELIAEIQGVVHATS